MKVLAIFGPTGVGKTDVAIAVADLLRGRGENPVAVSCDALQVYRGIETLTGAPDEVGRERLEHRLVGVVGVVEEFSAGRFATLARREIDGLLAEGRRPIVVGGTGLYLRAALAEIELQPPVSPQVRSAVEREIAERGPAALHGELDPDLAMTVHPNDRKRVARLTELQRAGVDPPRGAGALWTARLRYPTVLVGLVIEREELARRVEERVEAMAAGGAGEEARRAADAGASRTVRAAIGFDEFLRGDLEAVRREQLAYARRQITWMRKMPGVHLVDRTGRTGEEAAGEILDLLGLNGGP